MRLTRRNIVPAARRVTFTFDGREVEALVGERFADALVANGILAMSRRGDSWRSMFCGMGVCNDCLITVDGRAGERACMAKVVGGERVASTPPRGTPDDPLRPLIPDPDKASPEEIETDILVVGGGPAGTSAALAAAGQGADVTLLDERSDIGGQYLKPLAASQQAEGRLDRQFALGLARTAALRASPVRVVTEALVWGAFAPDEVLALVAGRATVYRSRRIILATGAYERPMPFPGWTLPGVMTAGAAQTLVRSYGVAPGRRTVIAGNGPLNLQVAAELVKGGAEVVAVVESASRPGIASVFAALSAAMIAPRLLADGVRYLAILRQARVPLVWSHVPVNAEGALSVRSLTIAPISEDGRIRADRSRSLDADAVCLGYGFIASSEIARALGCRMIRDSRHLGSLSVETNTEGETSVPGVFACGDGAIFAGAQTAAAAGAIAGATAASQLGLANGKHTVARSRRAFSRARHFQHALWRIFAPPRTRIQDTPDDAIACRCEALTFGILRAAVKDGADTLASLKRMTRMGMGRCQGRYCVPLAVHLIPAGNEWPAELATLAPRLPAKPFPAAAVAFEKPEWRGLERGPGPDLAHPVAEPPFGETRAGTLVVGAGILGACVATYLARVGEDVMVIDRDAANLQASGANAGSLHVQLLSFDFGTEVSEKSGAAQVLPLGPWSIALWRELAAAAGDDFEMQTTGGLMVADSAAGIAFLEAKAKLERRFGIEAEVIGRSDLLSLAPALASDLLGAEFAPQEGKINPLSATYRVLDLARGLGVRYARSTDLTALSRDGAEWIAATSRGTIRAKRVVNAAGPWAGAVAAMAGIALPVFTGPIQMVVTEPSPLLVTQLVAHAERHLSLKQATAGGILIGGAWPARHDPVQRLNVPLRDSIEGNVWVARRVLPSLRGLRIVRAWSGMNVNIDGAPVIGGVPGVPGFFNAITSNGYTLAPAVARLCTDVIMGAVPSFDLSPFSIARFS